VAATRKSFLLRLPPDLYEDLERWAAQDLRSVNAQIEFLLREQVRKRKGGDTGRDKGVNRRKAPEAGEK
jgi:hypothetical protein